MHNMAQGQCMENIEHFLLRRCDKRENGFGEAYGRDCRCVSESM